MHGGSGCRVDNETPKASLPMPPGHHGHGGVVALGCGHGGKDCMDASDVVLETGMFMCAPQNLKKNIMLFTLN